jgi:DNA primase
MKKERLEARKDAVSYFWVSNFQMVPIEDRKYHVLGFGRKVLSAIATLH